MATDPFLTTKSILGLAERVVTCPPQTLRFNIVNEGDSSNNFEGSGKFTTQWELDLVSNLINRGVGFFIVNFSIKKSSSSGSSKSFSGIAFASDINSVSGWLRASGIACLGGILMSYCGAIFKLILDKDGSYEFSCWVTKDGYLDQ